MTNNIINTPNTKFALLVYDIPADSKLRNPSMLLRRWGARINLSCWVLPTKNLALIPMKDWIEKGATVEVVEFEEHEREKVVALARRAIQRDVEEMSSFVENAVREVRRRCSLVERHPSGSAEREEVLERAEKYAYTALWRAKGIADAAEEAALHFALTADIEQIVEALRHSIKAKSASFFSIVSDAKKSTRFIGDRS